MKMWLEMMSMKGWSICEIYKNAWTGKRLYRGRMDGTCKGDRA